MLILVLVEIHVIQLGISYNYLGLHGLLHQPMLPRHVLQCRLRAKIDRMTSIEDNLPELCWDGEAFGVCQDISRDMSLGELREEVPRILRCKWCARSLVCLRRVMIAGMDCEYNRKACFATRISSLD
jgi:hypothetical protein